MKAGVKLVLVSFALSTAAGAAAQSYPSKPIRIVVSYPAGGSTDIVGRALGQKLSDLAGRSVVIENRAGASGTIGADYAAKSAPDGYTLLLAAGAHALAQSLYLKLPYDLTRDFAPIGLAAKSAYLLVLHPSVPAKSVKQLVAIAKATPGRLNYASTGMGSTPHLAAELFNTMTGVKMTNVPYKGDAPAIADLLGGHVDLSFIGISSVSQHVTAGKLRALAVTGAQRSSALPALPTIAEAGVPGYEFSTWWGLVAPAGTPRDIVSRLAQHTAKMARMADLRERFTALGIDAASTGTPEEFGAFIRAEVEKYAKIAKAAGVEPQSIH
ncbi:MAG: tripartite tricarboxylate transporter substrate binding protein [Burkholderiales bacterium]|nr:tripartite tricarboxylate transporter substrate binding protein [Burkholderiales bacterium]